MEIYRIIGYLYYGNLSNIGYLYYGNLSNIGYYIMEIYRILDILLWKYIELCYFYMKISNYWFVFINKIP